MNEKSTKHSKTNWAKLRRSNDKSIDYSDIPETDAAFWRDAEVVVPPHKVHLSVRFDEDIVEYFKRDGKGYQTRMNAVLRHYMKSHLKRAA